MTATCKPVQQPIIGWYCESTFPALFTDSLSVAKRWMELGSKVSAVVRQDDTAASSANPATPADDALGDRDAAFEAVRKGLCALQRYSFWIGPSGGVKRVEDRSGNWIDFDAAHELFDPVNVDAAIATQQGKAGEA